ncbi:MAG: RIP metalloprotease RseP [Dysgonomonas sp.]
MESFLIRALQLILSLSILVLVHEFGHFLFARIFKIRVEKFYLFFNPWFSLFKFKPKNSETEYGIGWVPLGGYVKISGMIDESMDKEQMAQPPQPWEFRSKPAWQRLLVMVGGVLFNFLLAIFIYSMVLFSSGDKYLMMKDAAYGMEFSNVPKEVGFKDGDIVVSADGKELRYRDSKTLDMNMLLDILDADQVTVMRDGKETNISIPDDFMDKFIAAKEGFWAFNTPVVVDSVIAGKEADRIGLKKGDKLLGIDSVETKTFMSFRERLISKKGNNVSLQVLRGNETLNFTAGIDTSGTIGFWTNADPMSVYKNDVKADKFSFFGSFPAGIKLGIETLKGYIAQFKLVFTKEGVKNIGSFGAIGSMFPPQWEWHSFWMMTAFLSIILAVMNILPIPALDGGHVVFLLYEVITRRKPSEKFMEYAQIVGMAFLFILILYAIGNDIFRFLF